MKQCIHPKYINLFDNPPDRHCQRKVTTFLISSTALSAPTGQQLGQHQLGYEHRHVVGQLLQMVQIQDLPADLQHIRD